MTDETKFDALFQAAGEAHGVDWLLLRAQAIEESGLNPKAVSPAGAMGLAQFMPATWAQFGHGSPFDPAAAIDAQARCMAWLIKHFKHDGIGTALAAYNFGIGHVEREMPMPQETIRYVAEITARWQAFQAQAQPGDRLDAGGSLDLVDDVAAVVDEPPAGVPGPAVSGGGAVDGRADQGVAGHSA